MLYHSNDSLISKYQDILNESRNAIIFSPYIKLHALETLLEGTLTKIETIITTWKPVDIVLGVTDIAVYQFCKLNNIQLLINNRIHLKSIVLDDFSTCLVTSSNITQNGLALSSAYNFELGSYTESLTVEDKCYFDSIIDSAVIVTDEYYLKILDQIKNIPRNIDAIPKNFDTSDLIEKRYLTSRLPYSDRPEYIFDVITNPSKYEEEEIRSVHHDLNLYKIRNKGNQDQIKNELKENFTKDYFIQELLEYNAEGRYFGELTAWLHNRIQNVPSPKRFEVKEYLKRIFAYISYLLENEYEICIPKSHSQFLRRNESWKRIQGNF